MELFLSTCVVAGMPLLFAVIGEIFTEKAGCLNLGVEGLMLLGAVFGFIGALKTQNPYMAIIFAALAGGVGSLIYAFFVVSLRSNQNVTGLTLTIFATGITRFLGQPLLGSTVPSEVTGFFVRRGVPLLKSIPFLGQIFFNQDLFVYFGYVVAVVSFFYIYKSRPGLNLRAVGENAAAADASGINVSLYKYVHVILGGALCGLGGAYLSLVRIPIWQEDVVAGRGWIAVALVIFASWNPAKAFFASILFGGLSILGLRLQALGFTFSQYIVDMIPYAATIVIVVLSTKRGDRTNLGPAGLGQNYFREDR